jgi:hypothetical protein
LYFCVKYEPPFFMKNLFRCLGVFVVLFIFSGCSNDDDSNASNKVISKITIKSFDYNEDELVLLTQAQIFDYENGQVSKISLSDGVDYYCNYEGDKLINISSEDGDYQETFSYEDDKIIQVQSPEVRSKYLYDKNKNLGEIKTSYISSNFMKEFSSFYYFTENNATSIKQNTFYLSDEITTTYKFDNKNNPYKNHNKYFKLTYGDINQNNVIEESSYLRTIKYTIEYDLDGFPTKSTGIDQETGKLWTEYIYEYKTL